MLLYNCQLIRGVTSLVIINANKIKTVIEDFRHRSMVTSCGCFVLLSYFLVMGFDSSKPLKKKSSNILHSYLISFMYLSSMFQLVNKIRKIKSYLTIWRQYFWLFGFLVFLNFGNASKNNVLFRTDTLWFIKVIIKVNKEIKILYYIIYVHNISIYIYLYILTNIKIFFLLIN